LVADTEEIIGALCQLISGAHDETIGRVYIFGSQLARPTATSDVDVLIVRDDGADLAAVSVVSKQMSAWFLATTGRRLDQIRVSESELAESGFLGTITPRLIWTRH
jgi:predicted nucleotidyltransferase